MGSLAIYYLDLVHFFKALKSNDPNIVVKSSGRVTRHNSTKNILTNVPRVNTLTFQNSYRAPRTYNCLPSYIRDADVTIGQSYLLIYYHEMTDLSEAIRWLKAEYIMKNERGISISIAISNPL
jgi:hypothetical protein